MSGGESLITGEIKPELDLGLEITRQAVREEEDEAIADGEVPKARVSRRAR